MAAVKLTKTERVKKFMADHPDIESPTEIAERLKRFDVTPATVSNVKSQLKTNGHTNGVHHKPEEKESSMDWKMCVRMASNLIFKTGSLQAAIDCCEVADYCRTRHEKKA